MDTGDLHDQEPIIELLNGEFRGPLGWAHHEHGPLTRLGRLRQRASP
ncbi:hypothetical protein GCM10009850_005070 [Nonomuraea monospora]|uniref:Uncharacterized protein n=1 Tax=Nonomuraea monospora TaxID=568818 RepID=A0ABN3C628_9ACTN